MKGSLEVHVNMEPNVNLRKTFENLDDFAAGDWPVL